LPQIDILKGSRLHFNNNFTSKNSLGPNMIGIPHWTLRTHSKDSQIHLSLHFSYNLFYISTFFFMSNEIIFFQFLYKISIFSFMKVRIIKFIQCGPYSINGLKLSEIWLFKKNYITIGHLVLVTFIHFIHIST